MDISIQLSMLIWISNWISLDFYGYPCIDLIWILDSGGFEQISLANLVIVRTLISHDGVSNKANILIMCIRFCSTFIMGNKAGHLKLFSFFIRATP